MANKPAGGLSVPTGEPCRLLSMMSERRACRFELLGHAVERPARNR